MRDDETALATGGSRLGEDAARWNGERPVERASADLAVARERLDRDLISEQLPRALLDLRAGSGALVRAVRERKGFAVGCEPDDGLRDLATRAFQVDLHASISAVMEEDPATYTEVVAYGLIEHVIDPDGLLAISRRLLVPGGHLVLETHSAESRNFERLGNAWCWANPHRVAHLYTGSELVEVVERHRLKTVDLFSPDEDTVVIIARAVG